MMVLASRSCDLEEASFGPHWARPWAGVWHSDPARSEFILVVESERLPRKEGWSFLRWLRTPQTPAQFDESLSDLLADRTLSIFFRRKIMESIMDGKIAASEEQRLGNWRHLRDDVRREAREEGLRLGREEGRRSGRRAGRREGRQEGREEGFTALLRVAEQVATPEQLMALRAIRDLEVLAQRVSALVAGP